MYGGPAGTYWAKKIGHHAGTIAENDGAKKGSRLLSDYAGLTPWFVTSARKLASYVATLPSERWSRKIKKAVWCKIAPAAPPASAPATAAPLTLSSSSNYVIQSTTPLLLRTTKYYTSTTPYYKVLLQYHSVLQSTTPVPLRTSKYYSSTIPYYKVLLQY